MAMEFLSIMFEIESIKGNLSAIYKSKPDILLFYIDDLLVFAKIHMENASSIKEIMTKFKIYYIVHE